MRRPIVDLARAQFAPVLVDPRFPVAAAACGRWVYLRPDATEAERRRAIATWLLASTGGAFTAADIDSVEILL